MGYWLLARRSLPTRQIWPTTSATPRPCTRSFGGTTTYRRSYRSRGQAGW
jgi:hypothetical protein